MSNSVRLFFSIQLFIFALSMLACKEFVGERKEITLNKNEISIKEIDTSKSVAKAKSNSDELQFDIPLIKLERSAFGKLISFNIDPQHIGGEAWTTIWEEKVGDPTFERTNKVCQLSPTVLLYRRFPKEAAKDFYYTDQADKIEFLNEDYTTAKIVDVWKNRPYQDINNARLTYHHFDAEAYNVIPYKNQTDKSKPNEYTLHTYVRSEGNHVIVNYGLRSLITKLGNQVGYEYGSIIGVKHTLRIYDLKGNLEFELKDMPSVDEAVVSNNGEFMMYTFGGIGLETMNNPFGTLEREGWALMRLKDQKIVYQEYTDDGKLAFGRLWMEQGYLRVGYSTPSTVLDYDYWIFYDELSNNIYLHKLTKAERDIMRDDYKKSSNSFEYKKYFQKFNFQQIPILNK